MSFDPTPYNEQGHGAERDPVITRGNYENYFLLYLDNELSTEMRVAVESFVQLHPDLKEELELLSQFRLEPDTDITYEPKAELMRSEPEISEALLGSLLLYTDDELDAAGRREVEAQANANPLVHLELSRLQQTKLQPDTSIVFPDKSSLYRKEEKVRIVYFNWRRIAVAAVLLLSLGLTMNWYLNRKTPQSKIETAGLNNNGSNKEQKNELASGTPQQNNSNEQEQILPGVKNSVTDAVTAQTQRNISSDKIKNDIPEPVIAQQPLQQKDDQQNAIAMNNDTRPSNNLPQPYDDPNTRTGRTTTGSIDPLTTIERPDGQTRPNADVINASYPVTKSDINPSDYTDGAQSSGNKNKLRGFFRKVTRTFEKKTNINATDDQERLLVGGLAIRLK